MLRNPPFLVRGERACLAPARKISPALLSQGRAKFSGKGKENPFPPQQREFLSDYSGARIKRFQTFFLILPNLIHKSKKLNLNR